MNVKELLTRTPINEVLDALVFLYYADPERVAGVRDDYTEFIKHIESIQPIPTDHVVLGMSIVDEGNSSFSSFLYAKADLSEWFTKPSSLSNVNDDVTLSPEQIEDLLEANPMPESYAFELSPWPEILGYEVNEKNIKDCGAGALLADILYEMSFFGFEESSKDEPLQSLHESIQELDDIKKLPPEEQEQHFHTMDDVFSELGWERPVHTLEEDAQAAPSQAQKIHHPSYGNAAPVLQAVAF